MSFVMPPSAVTFTSSIIIILTLVHPFATSWPSSPKGDARTLRDWLSVSYVTQYPVPPIFSFPLEGKSREAGKGVRGRAPIGCSIAVLTANRRPVSFLLLTLGHTFGVRVHRAQKGRFLRWTGPKAGGFLSLTGLWPEGCGGGFAADFIKKGRGWRRRLCRRVVFASLRGRQRLCR